MADVEVLSLSLSLLFFPSLGMMLIQRGKSSHKRVQGSDDGFVPRTFKEKKA
jgi:hypothetical protein